MQFTLFIISISILIGFLLLPLAKRLGAPLLLVLLGLGMLLGEEGIGQIPFDNFHLAYDIGSVALAIILFAGGLETDRNVFKKAGSASISLATLGVLVTAFVVGITAHFLIGLSLLMAFLFGAVIASTDAAATFMMLQKSGLSLNERVKQTLLLESGLNDPAAIFLTIVLTSLIGGHSQLDINAAIQFLILITQQFGLGLIGGYLGGYSIVFLINKIELPAGTYPAVSMAGAIAIFSGIATLGGSGFLAVYLVGIILRNKSKHPLDRIINFSEGLQWVSQILLFVMLGLLVTPSDLGRDIWQAIIIACVLIFIARPLAVFLSLVFTKFSIKEKLFLSWVGLRGAVPILLAMYPVIAPGPVSTDFFNIVFVVVTTSLILQSWTIEPLGKILGLNKSNI
ncbi:MAG: potassium/proton antiporter [Alphaproteobacteria bacterium]|nr:potassium/proton antiporter [Alphaproteobacteria bacterium]HPF46240.1 potassium/proton antiporter [Emcibacteraceae bacterium]HRW28621.1 potassium/proton antiporter [Emcibacteraceae bacterium]